MKEFVSQPAEKGSKAIDTSSPPTRRQIAFSLFQKKLREFAAPTKELSGTEELETILPFEERQAIWRELQAAGFKLPELVTSPWVFLIAAAMVLAPVVLLALALRTWFVYLSIIELSLLAYKFTRPLAIHPPVCCTTVGQAVLRLRDVRGPDGRKVPWTRDDIAERVRMIIADNAGLPLEKVIDGSCFNDLLT